MYKKILFPTDGSRAALLAAEAVAAQWASEKDLQITLVVVTMPLDIQSSDFDLEFVDAHNTHMQRQAEAVLTKVSGVFCQHGIHPTTRILEGNPVSAVIAQEARDGAYDLIAMSSRGLGMQHDKLHYMGSVTQHVIRRVSIPVLVLPVQEDEDDS